MAMVGVVTGLCLLAGCGIATSAAEREADQHALNAGIVLTRGIDPVGTLSAAGRVLGSTGHTTIEALRADGTNWSGHLTLKITVTRSQGTLNHETATRCYEYTFKRLAADDIPQRLSDCPPGPPLAMPREAPPVDLSAAEALRLAALLNALSPADRVNAAAVQRALTKAYPPPIVVGASKTSSTQMYLMIRLATPFSYSASDCIDGTLPATGAAQVSAHHGYYCTGG